MDKICLKHKVKMCLNFIQLQYTRMNSVYMK